MSGFQEKGVRKQRESMTRAEADRNYEHSCDLCMPQNRSCANCPIANAHKFVIDTFDLMEEVNASLRAVHAR